MVKLLEVQSDVSSVVFRWLKSWWSAHRCSGLLRGGGWRWVSGGFDDVVPHTLSVSLKLGSSELGRLECVLNVPDFGFSRVKVSKAFEVIHNVWRHRTVDHNTSEEASLL